MRFCENCGKELKEYSNFCDQCGEKVATVPNSSFRGSRKLLTRKKVIVGISILLAVLTVVLLVNTFSLEKRLMRTVWWSVPEFENEPYDFSDSSWFQEDHPNSPVKGYWVDGECRSLLFCEYGTIRFVDYSTPGYYGGAYAVSSEITADNYPGYFDWRANSYNSWTWSLLPGKKLSYKDDVYTWDKEESKDTWYMTFNTLRIGEDYYSKKKPRMGEVAELPAYWCANCGNEGPFSHACPQCDSTKKRTD